MYGNLIAAMKVRKMTMKKLASILKVSEKSLFNKIYGKTRLYLDEALCIYKVLNKGVDEEQEFTFDYLFKKEEVTA